MDHADAALLNPEAIFKHVPLKPGMRLADFGCGRTGHFIFFAARKVEDTGVVYAVDVMKEILASIAGRARSEGYDTIQTVWSDIEQLGATPIPEASLDVVTMVSLLAHLKEQAGAMAEARRLLKNGGKLLIIDWARRLGPLGPSQEKMLSATAVKTMGTTAGFAAIDEFVAGEYHFGVVLEKQPS